MTRRQYDIWYAYFRYSDEDDGKERPVLVLDPGEYFSLSAEITSHEPRNNYVGEVRIIEWKAANLKNPSTVRLSQKLDLTDFDFTKRIGRLQPVDIQNVRDALKVLNDI